MLDEVEAALICTPIHSHYGLTAFLIEHGIHCHTETQWCSTVEQARHLVALARKNNVVANVAEMFPHMPQDVFARALRDRGDIGSIGRIFSYGANANYHNCARWAFWAGRAPDSVQAQAHDISNAAVADRWISRQFLWDDELLVIDQRAGLNGSLGRGGRPGYEEWHGSRGTLRHQSIAHRPFDGEQTVFQYDECGEALATVPVERTVKGSCLKQLRCQLPQGLLQVENTFYSRARIGWVHATYWYASAVIAHLHDFAMAVQYKTLPQMTSELSLATVCMENAAAASIALDGKHIQLANFDGSDLEEQQIQTWKQELGYDPNDIEAVVDGGRVLRR